MKKLFTLSVCALMCFLVLAGCSSMTVAKFIELNEESFNEAFAENEAIEDVMTVEMLDEDGVLVFELKLLVDLSALGVSDDEVGSFFEEGFSGFEENASLALDEMDSLGVPNPKVTIRGLTVDGTEVYSETYEK